MIENENTDNSSINSLYSCENHNKIKEDLFDDNEKEDDYDNTSGIIQIIAELLKDICDEGKINKEEKLKLVKTFTCQKIPSISINDYIERLYKYSKVSKETFIFILIYIDQICDKHKIFLNYNNIHKLILASFIVAIKFYEDEHYSLNFYAKLGGISKKELLILEYEFLALIDFQLYIGEELFNKYNDYLQNLDNDEY